MSLQTMWRKRPVMSSPLTRSLPPGYTSIKRRRFEMEAPQGILAGDLSAARSMALITCSGERWWIM